MGAWTDLMSVINNAGTLNFSGTRSIIKSSTGLPNLNANKSSYNFMNAALRVVNGTNTIDIKPMSETPAAGAANAIVVNWVEDQAVFGTSATLPVYVISFGFNSCKFYLCEANGNIFGVHASRSTIGLTSPKDSIQSMTGRVIWKFDSRRHTGSDYKHQQGVICYVKANVAHCCAFQYIENMKSPRMTIVRSVENTRINNWNHLPASYPIQGGTAGTAVAGIAVSHDIQPIVTSAKSIFPGSD